MSGAAGIWALIPVRARGTGKTRLAAALSPRERDDLVDAMLDRVVRASAAVVDRTLLVGPARGNLPFIPDAPGGLNPALDRALAVVARGDAPGRVIVLAADLPCLTTEEVRHLARLPAGTVGIATDRHGTGTNALSLPLPGAAGFRFHYGTGSAALHRREAERLGLNAVTITLPGLAKDVDEAADLADAEFLFDLTN